MSSLLSGVLTSAQAEKELRLSQDTSKGATQMIEQLMQQFAQTQEQNWGMENMNGHGHRHAEHVEHAARGGGQGEGEGEGDGERGKEGR